MAKKRRRSKRAQHNRLVLELLLLVAAVLVIFEGRLIMIMLSQRSGSPTVTVEEDADQGRDNTDSSPSSDNQNGTADSITVGVAGFMARMNGSYAAAQPAASDTADTADADTDEDEPEDTADISAADTEAIDDPSVVPEQNESVDDSYFSDAVFIGDSRMEGFRNASGITQGDFLTSVGMTLTSLSTETVSTSEGQITVYQGLSGKQYGKIYLMLGANDLGFYPMSDFLSVATGALETIHELQPNAVIYICNVIYVEESKVTTEYVNNANVQTVNGYLLEACQDLSYCYYINLNEIFSDGYHQLISGASADGVHLNPEYLEQMLEYLKSHYIVWDSTEEEAETE